MKQGFMWSQLRAARALDLQPGDSWVLPGVGTAYRSYADGAVAGVGWLPCEGTVWTLTERKGSVLTARNANGQEATQEAREATRVLRVVPGTT